MALLDRDGQRIVVASFAGATNHPDWYLNLADRERNPEVLCKVAAGAYWSAQEILDGDDYATCWAQLTADRAWYNDYQAKTQRRIPLVRLPEIDLVNDKAGKPVGIQQVIGRRPIMAFGNSDGDFEMLEWTTTAPGPRLGVMIHHTDSEHEWAYDRTSSIGRLARGLDEAAKRGWQVVDMKRDWETVFR